MTSILASIGSKVSPTRASLLTRAKFHHWHKTPHQSKVLPLEQVSSPEQSLTNWSKSPHQSKVSPLEQDTPPEQSAPTGASLPTRAKSHPVEQVFSPETFKTSHHSKLSTREKSVHLTKDFPLKQVSPPDQRRSTGKSILARAISPN